MTEELKCPEELVLSNWRVTGKERLNIPYKNSALVIYPLFRAIDGFGVNRVCDFFTGMDSKLVDYLGFDTCVTDDDALKLIDTLHGKEYERGNKYWLISYEGRYVGIFYVYGYRQEYARCDVAIGLSPCVRGKGVAIEVLKVVCPMILSQGIIRIGVEVEDTNESSMLMMIRVCDEIGFRCEGKLRNQYGRGIDCWVYSLIEENV